MIRIQKLLLAALLAAASGHIAYAVTLADFPAAQNNYDRFILIENAPGMKTLRLERIAMNLGGDVLQELPIINAIVIAVPKGRQFSTLPEVVQVYPDTYYPKMFVNMTQEEERGAALGNFQALEGMELQPIKSPKPADKEPWGVYKVNAPGAWAKGIFGQGVKVAVVDTGIDFNHPDLAAVIAPEKGFNAINPKASPADDEGHGTHVSGTIAAAQNAKYPGIAPKVTLYAVKVLNKDGGGYLSDIISGLQWCVKHHIQVANMSLGADTPDEVKPFHDAVKAVAKQGLIIIAAAGNSYSGPVGIPARYPEVIAISAVDRNNAFADFSSKGKEVAFAAPGVDVWSTFMGGKYEQMSGTSMATPHMTGLAALALSAHPKTKGAAQMRLLLTPAAKKLPGLTQDQQGAGLIDAAKLAH